MEGTPLSRRRLMTGLALAAGLTIGGYAPFGAATASAALPGDGEPSDPDEVEAATILASLRLVSFTATPSVVLPFKSTTLAWSVLRSGPSVGVTGIQFYVAGALVGSSGQKVVTPVLDAQAYQIKAKFNGYSRLLGSRIVTVDTSQALRLPISAGQLQPLVKASLNSLPPEVKERLRSPSTSVAINSAGVQVKIVSEVEVDNFVNPMVTISLTIGLTASNGFLRSQLLASNVKVDFPWWVDFVPPIVSSFIQNEIADRIKSQVQAALPTVVAAAASQVATLPAGYGFWSVVFGTGFLELLISQR